MIDIAAVQARVDKERAGGLRVAWRPLPGSQTLALSCPAHIILYHGTRGPGKTDAQLVRFRRNVGRGYGAYWRGVIFDREYKNLDDLVAKSMRWFKNDSGNGRFLSSKSDYRWVWPTGEELLFRTLKRDSDYWLYHGQEFPFIGWNELTKYKDSNLFEMLMSCNRSSFLPEEHPIIDEEGKVLEVLPDIPLEVFATTNPYGVGHTWVKKRFISAAPRGRIVRKTVNVFNPRTQQREDVVKTQVHLFGSYRENKYLSPDYIAELEGMTDKNKRKAWLGGSWDITAGGMFDDLWDSDYHILRPFAVPLNWRIQRTFDWGSSKPFSVGWWARSDGSDVQLANGSWRSTVRGDVFRIGEWYGCTGKPNQGLQMLDKDIAAGIIEREIVLGIHQRVFPGPADNSIWDLDNGNTRAAEMSRPTRLRNGRIVAGPQFSRSDKSPGSRKVGWLRCRDYLAGALPQFIVRNEQQIQIPREKPGLFCFDTCTNFIELFHSLPRDEDDMDDVDTDAEDHIGDETRYYILDQVMGGRSGRTKGT